MISKMVITVKWWLLHIVILAALLTHWRQVTHICISRLTIIGSDNGLSPSHYLNQCWNIVNLTPRNKLQWNIDWNSYISIQENGFEMVVCVMAAILSWPQCVNSLRPSNCGWCHGSWWALIGSGDGFLFDKKYCSKQKFCEVQSYPSIQSYSHFMVSVVHRHSVLISVDLCLFVPALVVPLTHWGRNKMADIYHTTFSNEFSWMKMDKFRVRFHWSLYPRVQLRIFQHWLR